MCRSTRRCRARDELLHDHFVGEPVHGRARRDRVDLLREIDDPGPCSRRARHCGAAQSTARAPLRMGGPSKSAAKRRGSRRRPSAAAGNRSIANSRSAFGRARPLQSGTPRLQRPSFQHRIAELAHPLRLRRTFAFAVGIASVCGYTSTRSGSIARFTGAPVPARPDGKRGAQRRSPRLDGELGAVALRRCARPAGDQSRRVDAHRVGRQHDPYLAPVVPVRFHGSMPQGVTRPRPSSARPPPGRSRETTPSTRRRDAATPPRRPLARPGLRASRCDPPARTPPRDRV